MTSQIPWYVARSAGLIAWALLTASVVWGLALSTKLLGRRPRPAWLLDLHRFLGALASVFTALHIGAIVADSYVHFDLMSILVPFASRWRPGAVAWGVAGLYLLLAIELTSLARSHLPRRLWRVTHMASFPLFFVATMHALTAGTDGHTWAFEGMAVSAIVVVSGLAAMRLTADNQRGAASRITVRA